MREVKILGTGCSKCTRLYKLVIEIIEKDGIEGVEVEQVKDIDKIIQYGVMVTPALVVDGEVKVSGRIPSEDKLSLWLK